VNTRAHDLVVILRGVHGGLPGATAISFHAFPAWTYLLISASTDSAVDTLGYDLGLGAPEIRLARKAWWLRAMSETRCGQVRVEVIGPPRRGRPPVQ
jgi:hypothetical protein